MSISAHLSSLLWEVGVGGLNIQGYSQLQSDFDPSPGYRKTAKHGPERWLLWQRIQVQFAASTW